MQAYQVKLGSLDKEYPSKACSTPATTKGPSQADEVRTRKVPAAWSCRPRLAFLLIWEGAVAAGFVPRAFLPAPSDIPRAFLKEVLRLLAVLDPVQPGTLLCWAS